jgi:hypothetical protein
MSDLPEKRPLRSDGVADRQQQGAGPSTEPLSRLGIDPHEIGSRGVARKVGARARVPKTRRLKELAMTVRDPRSEAEKARADLMRNDAMGMAPPHSPMERQPSVTPQTFGDHTEAARIRSGSDQGLEAGGIVPPGRGGSESIAEAEQASAGRDHTGPARQDGSTDDNVLSRGKE